ncbi:MAG: PDZ domain-containing protein [Acidimicrobiia bacterium]|nr:trypsin-like peptidase domain-containing protein [Acidimicrobiia bacterium]NNK90949.1 PDZ domain-containing protein [Acidimicrobiia bacterium]
MAEHIDPAPDPIPEAPTPESIDPAVVVPETDDSLAPPPESAALFPSLDPAPQPPPALPPELGTEDPMALFRPGAHDAPSPEPFSPVPAVTPPPTSGPHLPDPRWPQSWSPPIERVTPVPEPAPTAEPTPRRRWPTALLGLAAGFLGALVAVGAMWGFGVFDDASTAETSEAAPPTTVIERVVTEVVNPNADGTTLAAAVGRKVTPSIVTVEFGTDSAAGFTVVASGSGVVVSADGLVVTNEHVVADSDGFDARVVLSDGRVFPFEIVGEDALTDLAVIQVPATGLTPVDLGSTRDLSVGDVAIAIGNPLGLAGGPSLTVGVISAFNREVNPGFNASDRLFGMLQTDAPFTSGSSGGALVDGAGRLIGITTAVGVAEAGSGDVGFATPVELMTRITDEIIETGDVKHAFLGITGRDQLDRLDDGSLQPAGAVVITSEPDTAAERFGLQPGDVIVGFDDNEVRTMQDLVIGLRHYRVGTPVDFHINRDGTVETIVVELGERPEGL